MQRRPLLGAELLKKMGLSRGWSRRNLKRGAGERWDISRTCSYLPLLVALRQQTERADRNSSFLIPHSSVALFVYTCARHGYDRPQQHLWDEAHAAALAVETPG